MKDCTTEIRIVQEFLHHQQGFFKVTVGSCRAAHCAGRLHRARGQEPLRGLQVGRCRRNMAGEGRSIARWNVFVALRPPTGRAWQRREAALSQPSVTMQTVAAEEHLLPRGYEAPAR